MCGVWWQVDQATLERPKSSEAPTESGLAGALAAALASRYTATQGGKHF